MTAKGFIEQAQRPEAFSGYCYCLIMKGNKLRPTNETIQPFVKVGKA
jgi:hypothetical protein